MTTLQTTIIPRNFPVAAADVCRNCMGNCQCCAVGLAAFVANPDSNTYMKNSSREQRVKDIFAAYGRLKEKASRG